MANTPKSRRTQQGPAPRPAPSSPNRRAAWVKWVGVALILMMILPVIIVVAGSGLDF